jgi:hypothetical protein
MRISVPELLSFQFLHRTNNLEVHLEISSLFVAFLPHAGRPTAKICSSEQIHYATASKVLCIKTTTSPRKF